ncbi:uncharacterized protein PV07_00357 [Cladophialophora immunda]|uniref:Uncharacterized protein n=1 Tax=Cladophialophora immunda TaxID=569365 RepID=A0A0D2B7I6_9EURO|nr:uncharacterized protein PV07_00357 [Cladophialophora immunda]KIW33512.1 hypothetical protein PV07_00357 [Cladophialophora immunda]
MTRNRSSRRMVRDGGEKRPMRWDEFSYPCVTAGYEEVDRLRAQSPPHSLSPKSIAGGTIGLRLRTPSKLDAAVVRMSWTRLRRLLTDSLGGYGRLVFSLSW